MPTMSNVRTSKRSQAAGSEYSTVESLRDSLTRPQTLYGPINRTRVSEAGRDRLAPANQGEQFPRQAHVPDGPTLLQKVLLYLRNWGEADTHSALCPAGSLKLGEGDV